MKILWDFDPPKYDDPALRQAMAEASLEIEKQTRKTKQEGPLVVCVGNKAFFNFK